jgi:hypothetical protein
MSRHQSDTSRGSLLVNRGQAGSRGVDAFVELHELRPWLAALERS